MANKYYLKLILSNCRINEADFFPCKSISDKNDNALFQGNRYIDAAKELKNVKSKTKTTEIGVQ